VRRRLFGLGNLGDLGWTLDRTSLYTYTYTYTYMR